MYRIDTWQGGFGLWCFICGGCGAGQRNDARGLMLVPPLGRCVAHVGGVRQVVPPWPGSWFVPMPAPWCMFDAGRGVYDVFDVGAVNIVIRWAAELRRMVVSWPWLRRHGVGIVAACSRGCNSLGGKALVHVLMHGLAARSRQTHRRRDCCNSGPLLKGNPPCTVSGTWGTVVLGYGF